MTIKEHHQDLYNYYKDRYEERAKSWKANNFLDYIDEFAEKYANNQIRLIYENLPEIARPKVIGFSFFEKSFIIHTFFMFIPGLAAISYSNHFKLQHLKKKVNPVEANETKTIKSLMRENQDQLIRYGVNKVVVNEDIPYFNLEESELKYIDEVRKKSKLMIIVSTVLTFIFGFFIINIPILLIQYISMKSEPKDNTPSISFYSIKDN